MTHTICRECECQAHCMEKGCIPITPPEPLPLPVIDPTLIAEAE